MSIKGQRFLAHLSRPQVSSNFWVVIDHLPLSLYRCASATLPFSTRGESTISVSGQPVVIPGKEQVPGEWTCRLYESEYSDMSAFLDIIKQVEVPASHKTQSPYKFRFGNVFVFMTTSEGVPTTARWLQGAWIKSIEPVSLDYSNPGAPVVYSVTFRYQSCTSIL